MYMYAYMYMWKDKSLCELPRWDDVLLYLLCLSISESVMSYTLMPRGKDAAYMYMFSFLRGKQIIIAFIINVIQKLKPFCDCKG